MQSTIQRRIAVTQRHIVPQVDKQETLLSAEECIGTDIRTTRASSVPALSPKEVETLLTGYVQDHTALRRTIYDYFEQHQNEFGIRSGTGDGTLDFLRQRSHDQGTKILQQKFITVQDILDDPTKVP
jgi:hypothetical protein